MIKSLDILSPTEPLKSTISRCPQCLAEIPAVVARQDGAVVMTKVCPQHGRFVVQLSGDERFYFDSRGPASCCGGAESCDPMTGPATTAGAASTDPFDVLSSCIALIEIVDSCNLSCPTCYASSPVGTGDAVDCTPFEIFKSRVEGVLQRKGHIDILQLSGGEPTIHPEFFEILDWSLREPRIDYVLINTNAVRLARDRAFRERLAELRERLGGFELYVQFDGPQADGQVALRGADLRDLRRQAIDDCGALGVPTTLAMTVTPETRTFIGDTLRFGLQRPHCHGVTLQPMFHSGRTHEANPSELPVLDQPPPAQLAVSDIIHDAVAQCPDLLSHADFTPLPCGDPNCHTISYVLRTDEGHIPLSRLVDLSQLQDFLSERVNYKLDDLARCGCDNEPLGRVIQQFELSSDAPFRIFIKPFMDAWTFDQDRIDRCCTHVIRPDGKLDSFCRYYLHGGAAGVARP